MMASGLYSSSSNSNSCKNVAPGVEYDTVRGRGDFDAGYVNEYISTNSSPNKSPSSAGACGSAQRSLRRHQRITSSSTDSNPITKTEKRRTQQKQQKRLTTNSSPKRNLPYKSNTEEINDEENEVMAETHLPPSIALNQWKTAVPMC